MRRGLLLLISGVTGTAVGAVLLAACVPAAPAPSPTTATTTRPTTTTTTTTPTGGGAWAQNGSLGTCTVFPADNAWNRDVSALPADSNSGNYLTGIAGLGGNQKLHADFGGDGEYGIPYITVPGTQTKVPIDFTDYGDESDAGPYPIPLTAPVEGAATPTSSPSTATTASSTSCSPRARGRAVGRRRRARCSTSRRTPCARRAGRRPTPPGCRSSPDSCATTRWRAATSTTRCASRCRASQRAYLHPATHWASSSTDPNLPPMGLRFRLQASFDVSSYTGQARVVLNAMKKYGMIVADNGSNWFISGAADTRWNDDDLNQLKQVPGSAFEVVNTGESLHK